MWDILEKYEKAPLRLTDEEYLAVSDTEFCARFRERVHHTLEVQFYHALQTGRPMDAGQLKTAEHMCLLWQKRGLPEDHHDYQYAQRILSMARDCAEGKPVDLSPHAPPEVTDKDREVFFRVVHDRRSVRAFDMERDVPDELINKVLDAGLWAAHACNLQSIRYLVVREKDEPWLFRGSDIPPGPVHIAVLQDERCYLANTAMSLKNRVLDAGAATQNILLAIHAHGLDGVWLTYEAPMIDRLRRRFDLADYIRIVDFIDMGYGVQTPFPPQRPDVSERIIVRT
ncbi:MAG TPA: nitroreductase family protein [Candidatus Ventrousia excrementavium]|uniref:Nitroreductase family protein n=1 Tax=Candidatus Ventrousia excrementavium TaxID=2840961 RepID=A0A9D1LKQ5_9CLOT|nr:nitroreductase family protein [Candidatus Ventrousia excrementavium]